MTQGIIILDFGSQYNQLIARRIREFGVYTEIIPYHTSVEEIKKLDPKGIILSGGPSSVFGEAAALVEKELFELGIPVLGICYGMQLISHLLGGEVKKGEKGEYGKSELTVLAPNSLFNEVPTASTVWMSHFDEVVKAPNGFIVTGKSNIDIAALANEEKNIFPKPFQPGVNQSGVGSKVFGKFVF